MEVSIGGGNPCIRVVPNDGKNQTDLSMLLHK